jgi:predicted RNase H-like HicB family nuclease
MMNLSEKAQELASLPYTVITFRDRLSDGDDYVYIAFHPELDGCMAQGETLAEAKAFLNEIRLDYIEHLLEHNLPIPQPDWTKNSWLLLESETVRSSSESDNSETLFAIPDEK